MLDWTWDEDRCRLSSSRGPQNITRLRRFAIGLVTSKSKSNDSLAATSQKLARNLPLVFDDLGMTKSPLRHGSGFSTKLGDSSSAGASAICSILN
jgi:hypothetical protein